MVEVDGMWCPAVDQTCVRSAEPKHPEHDRCAEFARQSKCTTTKTHKHYCIDRYEFPNVAGEKPRVSVDWTDARDQCAAEGKRLCTDSEWTFACEGEELRPYPYGFVRDANACNIDRPYIRPNNAKWHNLATREAEIARLDQRHASGSDAACVSPFGVRDLTGNVDEWVANEKGKVDRSPYVSGLKGGYWGPVRDRCRPITTTHNADHSGYQIGFRCCADAGAGR
jgi:sulfatase modifying factor 1